MFCLLLPLVLISANDEKLFTLSPVPLSGNVLKVRANMYVDTDLKVELRNLIGRKLQEKKFPKYAEEIFFNDMLQYPNGLYVIQFKDLSNKIIESSKFNINR
ncbi:MAG: hypothetical protein R2831_00910 [Chitinophagaceae bacterium]